MEIDGELFDRDSFRSRGSEPTVERVSKKVPKGPLDEAIVEDADSRHEQFTEEAGRWLDES